MLRWPIVVLVALASCTNGGDAAPDTTVTAAPAVAGSTASTERAAHSATTGAGTAPATAVASTEAPRPTVSAITGGDPDRFCAALDVVFPAQLLVGLAGVEGEPSEAVEVALAPAVADALASAAVTGPRELAPLYAAWSARAGRALDAFRTLGLDAEAEAAYRAALLGWLADVQSGVVAEPTARAVLDRAVAFGAEASALTAAAAGLRQREGTLAELVERQASVLTPEAIATLGRDYPCLDALAAG